MNFLEKTRLELQGAAAPPRAILDHNWVQRNGWPHPWRPGHKWWVCSACEEGMNVPTGWVPDTRGCPGVPRETVR